MPYLYTVQYMYKHRKPMCVVKYVCIPGPFGSVQFHCLCPCNEPKNRSK